MADHNNWVLGPLIPATSAVPPLPTSPIPITTITKLAYSICRPRNANDPDWPVSLAGTERENVMAVSPVSLAQNGATSATMRRVSGNLEL